tara:strand:- start:632 stop:907 length:276 start_codon:yes stop_codon:yes gene_type:complete
MACVNGRDTKTGKPCGAKLKAMQEADADYERKRVVGTEELFSGIQPTRTRKTPFELMSGRPDPDDESIYEGMRQAMPFKNSSIDKILKKNK